MVLSAFLKLRVLAQSPCCKPMVLQLLDQEFKMIKNCNMQIKQKNKSIYYLVLISSALLCVLLACCAPLYQKFIKESSFKVHYQLCLDSHMLAYFLRHTLMQHSHPIQFRNFRQIVCILKYGRRDGKQKLNYFHLFAIELVEEQAAILLCIFLLNSLILLRLNAMLNLGLDFLLKDSNKSNVACFFTFYQ